MAAPPPLSPPERRATGEDWRGTLPPGTRNLLLTVEYDGSGFAGWQVQPGQRTVQGSLQRAVETLVRHGVIVRGAGRTDSGVHAWAQRASFFTDSNIHPNKLLRGINALAGGGVRVTAVQEVDARFDPLRSAVGKVYDYRLLLRPAPSVLLARAWHLRAELDLDLLAAELATLPGEADWSSYRAANCGARYTIKTMRSATLRREERGIVVLRFVGSGFLKQMVRILVGTAVDVALGRLEPGAMVRIRNEASREAAGPTAPPHGLFLYEVLYPPGVLPG